MCLDFLACLSGFIRGEGKNTNGQKGQKFSRELLSYEWERKRESRVGFGSAGTTLPDLDLALGLAFCTAVRLVIHVQCLVLFSLHLTAKLEHGNGGADNSRATALPLSLITPSPCRQHIFIDAGFWKAPAYI